MYQALPPLDPADCASFAIDPQCGFSPLCPGELPVPDALEIVPELNRLARLARLNILSRDAHCPTAIYHADADHPQFTPLKAANADIFWNRHCVVGTPGFELLPGLPAATSFDFVVYKGVEPTLHPYGACYHDLGGRLSTGVIEFLKQRGITTVLCGGLATDYCVKLTALQLHAAGLRTLVVLAACRGVAPASTDAALAELAAAGVELVGDCAALQPALAAGAAAAKAAAAARSLELARAAHGTFA